MFICGTFDGSTRGCVGQQVELGRHAFAAAQEAPRPVAVAFAFDRGAAVAQERELAHRAQAAAPLAGTGHVLAQLVAQHAQGQVGLDVLDRVVARDRRRRDSRRSPSRRDRRRPTSLAIPGLREDHDDAFRETGELPGRKVDPRR